MTDLIESAVRREGDLAGVFECDGETGYFYLYAREGASGRKVLDTIQVLSGEPDFAETDVAIRWDSTEQKVGLFIKRVLRGHRAA